MNVFWYALREKGARVYRTRPADRCPVRFIETYPKFLSQTVIVAICQRTRKRVKSESMLSNSFERHRFSRQASKNAQAECKVKACFHALLRRSRFSRRSLKDRTRRQGTIHPSVLRFSYFTSSSNRSVLSCFLCHHVHSCYNFKFD